MQIQESNNLLTMKQVMNLAGVRSHTTVYRRLELKCMPQPCQIGLGRLRWRERDIAAWIDGLDPGDEIIIQRDLTNKGPLQKHYFGRFWFGGSVGRRPQWGHGLSGGLMRRSMMACLIAGRLGFGGRPEILFSPFALLEPK